MGQFCTPLDNVAALLRALAVLLALVAGELVAKRTVLRHLLGEPVLQRPDERRQRPGKPEQLPEQGGDAPQQPPAAQPRELRMEPVEPLADRIRVGRVDPAHSSASTAMIAASTASRSPGGIAA